MFRKVWCKKRKASVKPVLPSTRAPDVVYRVPKSADSQPADADSAAVSFLGAAASKSIKVTNLGGSASGLTTVYTLGSPANGSTTACDYLASLSTDSLITSHFSSVSADSTIFSHVGSHAKNKNIRKIISKPKKIHVAEINILN